MDLNLEEALKAGGEILKDVESAVRSGNYSDLSGKVQGHVRTAADSISSEIKRNAGDVAKKYAGSSSGMSSSERGTRLHPKKASEYGRGPSKEHTGNESVTRETGLTPFMPKKITVNPGKLRKIAGILGIVYGGILTVPNIIRLIVGIVSGSGIVSASVTLAMGAAVLVLGILVLRRGIRETALIGKYLDYAKMIGSSEYFSIRELSAMTGQPEEEIRESIAGLMEAGYLPKAAFDRQKTTVLLTDKAISQYREAEKAYAEREENEREQAAEADKAYSGYSEEVKALLKEGTSYMTHVRNVNDRIPDDQVMSDKLYRLESIMNRIFAQVRKEPASAKNLRRFMDYYLPTITKLLDAYIELDKQNIQSSNIAGPKREIEGAMDTVNDAFEELLDSMFQNMAWDISSDISVMKTMMKQDGLTGSSPVEAEYETVSVKR